MDGNIQELNIQISADSKKAQKALQGLHDKLKELKNAFQIDVSNISKIGNTFESQKDSTALFSKELRKARKDLEKMQGISLSGITEQLKQISKISFANLESISNIDFKSLLKLQKDSKNITSSIKNLDEAFQGVKSNLNLDGLNTAQLEKGIARSQAELTKLLDKEQYLKISGKDIGEPWLKLQYNIALALSNIEKYSEALDKAKQKAKDITISKGTVEKSLYGLPRTAKTSKSSLQYNQSALAAVFPEYTGVKNFNDLMKKTGQNAAYTGIQINNAFGKSQKNVKQSAKNIQNIANATPNSASWKKISDSAKKIQKNFSAAFKYFKNLVSEIKKATKLLSYFSKKVASVFSIIPKISSGFSKMGKSMFGSGNKKNNFGIGQMLGTSILFSYVFRMLSAIQEAIRSGSDNLVQYSSSYNQAISGMVSALTQLKNSFATAFQPILEVAAPAIISFINLISKALTTVGAFFSALTGKTFSVKALETNIDYASGLQSVGSAAEGSADDVENLKKALSVLSFDELNQLQEMDSATGSGTPSGGGSINPEDMFVDIPISSYISDFAEKIKKAWEKADFTELGSIFGNKINSALNNIPWEKIKITTSKIAKSLATFLNGALQTIDFKLIGNTIAEAINTALIFVNDFVKNFKFDLLGKAIANGINGAIQGIDLKLFDESIKNLSSGISKAINNLFSNIEWSTNAEILSKGFNSVVDGLNILTTKIDFIDIGKNLAKAINKIAETVNFNNLGMLIGNTLMTIPSFLFGVVNDLDFSTIGRQLGKLINGIFSSINFSEIGNLLSVGFNGVFDSIKSFTLNVDWKSISTNITSGLNTMIYKIDWQKAGKNLNSFIINLLYAFSDTVKNTDWNKFGENIGLFLSQIDWGNILKKVVETISTVLGGLFEGLEASGTAGKIAVFLGKAFIAIKIANITGLTALAGKIIAFFVSKFAEAQSIKLVSDALKTTLSSGASSASSALNQLGGAASTISSGGLKQLATSLLGPAGVIVGVTATTYGIAKLVETAQGGNGKLTEMGAAINDLAGKLQNSSQITNQQATEIWNLVEACENNKMASEEMANTIIAKFSEWGISTQQVTSILQSNEFQTTKTKASVDLLSESAKKLGEGLSETKEKLDLSDIDPVKAFEEIRKSLIDLRETNTLVNDNFNTLDTILTEIKSTSSPNAQKALDAITKAMEEAGIPSDLLIESLGKKFPMAISAAKTSVDSNMLTAQKTVSSTTQKMYEDVKINTGKIKSDTQKNFSEMQSSVKNSTDGISNSTTTNWTDSKDSVTTAINSMKLDSSKGMNQVFKNVESYMTSIYNVITNKFKYAGERAGQLLDGFAKEVDTKMNSITKKFNGFDTKLKNGLGNMYAAGQSAARSFVNGFQSINIPTPHMYISSWDYHKVGNGNISTPNFSISWYKQGGLFTEATIAGIGEAGNEAVLPLENKRTMRMIADSIVNSSGGSGIGFSEEKIKQAVAQGVAIALMNNSQNQPPINVYAELKTESDEILARAVTRGQQKLDYRMNPTAQF